jgi:IMP cyclohydrolase
MYIGRIVSVARLKNGALAGLYRVSSRSFPNRTAVAGTQKVSIVPKEGHEQDVFKNPYIAYNCVRVVRDGALAVVTNGSHTDPIAEKIEMGLPVRDAIALSLLALDYEKDQYNTPRICAVADGRDDGAGWLGIVSDSGLEIRRIYLDPGRFWYVATYEEIHPSPHLSGDFDASDPEGCCDFILGKGLFADRTNAVTAVAAVSSGSSYDLYAKDAD